MRKDNHTVFLSIGSNVGDKRANLNAAIGVLDQSDHICVAGRSRYYRTQPQNYTDQDWFVNAVLKIETTLAPEALLLELKRMESGLDKKGKPFRFGPRVIDLDIIFYDDLVYQSEGLEIPHPRMHERCFVLVPMCDIAADKIHPVLRLTPAELINKIEEKETQEVILLGKEA